MYQKKIVSCASPTKPVLAIVLFSMIAKKRESLYYIINKVNAIP